MGQIEDDILEGSRKRILAVDDTAIVLTRIADTLRNDYEVVTVNSGARALKYLSQEKPDLILLDWNLPGQSGFELCAEIRACSDVPIIFVTGREDSMDEAAALLKGGDDYITKPFHPSVLLAHISAVLKRTRKEAQDSAVLIHLGLELDLAKAQVRYQGRRAELTRNELKILHCLFRHPGEIVPRTELIEYLWDASVFIDDNSLSIHVTRIRGKLKELGLPDFIHTKRGMGYFI